MKPVTAREIPDGFQLDWNDQTWNVAYTFRWSEFYDCYLDETHNFGRISVRPGDSLPEAFERAFDMPYTSEYEIFFLKEMP